MVNRIPCHHNPLKTHKNALKTVFLVAVNFIPATKNCLKCFKNSFKGTPLHKHLRQIKSLAKQQGLFYYVPYKWVKNYVKVYRDQRNYLVFPSPISGSKTLVKKMQIKSPFKDTTAPFLVVDLQ